MIFTAQARTSSSNSNSPVPRYDDLPAFSSLQTDGERERKAETQPAGTYGVVVTPDSFSDLPEYASAASPNNSRRMSVQSQSSLAGRPSPLSRTGTLQTDPNTVVLDRFEDVSPGAGSPFTLQSNDRRPSLPESMYYLAITTPPSAATPALATGSMGQPSPPGHSLIARFRHYIVERLCQPQVEGTSPGVILPGSTKDMFEIEAQRFAPVGDGPSQTTSFSNVCHSSITRCVASAL